MPLFWILSSIVGVTIILSMGCIYGEALVLSEGSDLSNSSFISWYW